jgi:L-malate glycosyltransferase
MKKVFILLRSLDVIGGTEVQTINLGKVLVDSGYEVSLVLYYYIEEELKDFFEKEGIKVKYLAIDERKGLFNLLNGLIKFLKKERPDIVHVQYMNPGLIPIIAAKLAGLSTIIAQIHQPATHYKRIHRFFVKIAGFLSDYFISVSLNTQNSWFGIKHLYQINQPFPSNITIYNSLYHTYKTFSEKIADRNSNSIFKIGIVGRLRWEKGQIFALEAFKELAKEKSTVELHIVGIGPDQDLLKGFCTEWQLKNKVFFYGQLTPEELNDFYHFIHLVIVPSRFEAFGLTAIESMLFEIPVIASNVDGLKEVIENGSDGFLVEFGDIEALKNKMELLIENKSLRLEMGAKGKEKVISKFSSEHYSSIIKDFYSRI